MEILDRFTAYNKIMGYKSDDAATAASSDYQLVDVTHDSVKVSFEYAGALVRHMVSGRLALYVGEGYTEIKSAEDLNGGYIFM